MLQGPMRPHNNYRIWVSTALLSQFMVPGYIFRPVLAYILNCEPEDKARDVHD